MRGMARNSRVRERIGRAHDGLEFTATFGVADGQSLNKAAAVYRSSATASELLIPWLDFMSGCLEDSNLAFAVGFVYAKSFS